MTSTLFIVPAFHHQEELNHVLAELTHDHVLIVDDGSQPPLISTKSMIRHPRNLGYGASQKTSFSFALSHGYDRIALVHGDNQYSIPHIQKALQTTPSSPILLGSRFLSGSSHNIPSWRRWGNRFLTYSANKKFNQSYSDLHTGARIYDRSFLSKLPYHSFSNGFLFDHQLLVWAMQHNISIQEFSIPAKYDTSVSSISFLNSVVYGLGCLHGIIAPPSP